MSKRIVYLSGGIFQLNSEECNGWRDQIIQALGHKYEFLNPMRRDYRGQEQNEEVAEQIVLNDLDDIHKSHIVVVYGVRPSWGTAMEVVYAYQDMVNIVTIHPTPDHMSPWLRHHSSTVVDSVEACIKYLEVLES